MLEYYTDVIVDELSTKLNGLRNVTVWGGSSFNRLRELLQAKESGVLPFVFVSTRWDVAQDNRAYAVMNGSGEITTRPYDDTAVPILYKPSLGICGKSEDEVIEIADALRTLYADGVMQKALIDSQGEEAIPLFIRIRNKDIEIEPRGGLSKKAFPIECYSTIVDFYPAATPKPLLTSMIDYGELKNNRDVQYRFIQIAQWCDRIARPIRIEKWLEDYHAIVDPSRTSNNRGCDFVALNNMSKNNEMPSREAFESCMEALIPICPDLFDRYVNKEPYSSTAAHIVGNMLRINQLKHTICKHLDLPEYEDMEIERAHQPREGTAFRHYLQYMDEDSSLLMRDVYCKYRRRLREEEKHNVANHQNAGSMLRNQLEPKPAHYHEEPQYEPTSSGVSLGGTILGSVLGNAIGNYGERRELKKQTRLIEKQTRVMEEADERAKRAEERAKRAENERKRRMRYEYHNYVHDMGTAAGRKKWEGRTPPPFPDYS